MSDKFLAVIPARGGSKGIARKNIREFLGKPLLGWTAEAATKSGIFERIVLSTEDEEIAEVGRQFQLEVPFMRPDELARDDTSTVSVISHAVLWMREAEDWRPDYVMILEPTSPGRRIFHIREAAEKLANGDVDSLASISEIPHHYNPDKILKINPDDSVEGIYGTQIKNMIHRRQDLKTFYAFNGLVFSCRADLLLEGSPSIWGDKVLSYIVDEKYDMNIDTLEEWSVAERRFRSILEVEPE